MPLAIVRTLHRLEQQMTQAKAQVHRRIAEVRRLVIDEGEAVFMREDVLRAVIAVTQSVRRRQQTVDQRPDGVGDLGATLLDAAVERIGAQLHEYGAIGEAFDKPRIAGSGL